MGGHGSGNFKITKKKCEDVMSVDVRWLKRSGWLELGATATLTWKLRGVTSGIMIATHADHVRANWASGGVHYSEKLPICRTAQRLGGERAWWSCPGCSSRCAILYMRSMRWRCRACHDLAYASTRNRCSIERSRCKHRLVLRKLGITDPSVTTAPDMNAPLFPDRPKGMHCATYSKLLRRHLMLRSETFELFNSLF